MLLSKNDLDNFKQEYPIMSTPELCQKYKNCVHKVNGKAKELGIYKTKIGKFKKVKY